MVPRLPNRPCRTNLIIGFTRTVFYKLKVIFNNMIKSNCPICDGVVSLPKDTEESEIISCPECRSRLVVTSLKNNTATLKEAPQVEEDWGE